MHCGDSGQLTCLYSNDEFCRRPESAAAGCPVPPAPGRSFRCRLPWAGGRGVLPSAWSWAISQDVRQGFNLGHSLVLHLLLTIPSQVRGFSAGIWSDTVDP